MSEFKFACPVCKQHITADSSSSGSHIACPTCFQTIIVPQAPASQDTKFIISAAQPDKPRPVSPMPGFAGNSRNNSRANGLAFSLAALTLAAVLGTGIFIFRDRLPGLHKKPPPPPELPPPDPKPAWTLDLAKAEIPSGAVSGKIKGRNFQCELAVIRGGRLSLRQGDSWPPELGIAVQLFASKAEDLAGKNIEVSPERTPPLPKVVLRWKDDQLEPQAETYQSGYLLRLSFGQPANNKLPGRIYICLPDAAESRAAGEFEAEILKKAQVEAEDVPPR